MADNRECAICQEDFDDGARGVFGGGAGGRAELTCGHEFHENCIRPWIERAQPLGASCPLCRRTPVVIRRVTRPPLRDVIRNAVGIAPVQQQPLQRNDRNVFRNNGQPVNLEDGDLIRILAFMIVIGFGVSMIWLAITALFHLIVFLLQSLVNFVGRLITLIEWNQMTYVVKTVTSFTAAGGRVLVGWGEYLGHVGVAQITHIEWKVHVEQVVNFIVIGVYSVGEEVAKRLQFLANSVATVVTQTEWMVYAETVYGFVVKLACYALDGGKEVIRWLQFMVDLVDTVVTQTEWRIYAETIFDFVVKIACFVLDGGKEVIRWLQFMANIVGETCTPAEWRGRVTECVTNLANKVASYSRT